MYEAIAKRHRTIAAYAAAVDKRKLPAELQREDVLYSRVFELLTDEIYKNETGRNTKMVVIITDSLPQQARKKHVEKPLKVFMKRKFQRNGIPYQLMHHQSCSSTYLQIADYPCWAVYRLYDKGLDWPFKNVSKCFREIGQISYVTT